MVPSKYKAIEGLFQQTDKTTNDSTFDIFAEDFGLKPGITWESIKNDIDRLNRQDHQSAYKLFFLARHGEGFHNIAPSFYNSTEWTCKYQMETGDEDMEWYDAILTPNGEQQIEQLSKFWSSQIHEHSAPTPQSYYVSPMRRTLQTFNSTWNTILPAGMSPMVKEFARETYGIGTESKRHSKQYIAKYWPNVRFETGFTEHDERWTSESHESKQHRKYRARVLLNDIFVTDKNDFISITAHQGIIKSILKVIHHRKWNLKTGEVLPVIIKASKFKKFEQPKLNKPWDHLPGYCNVSNELIN